ncbi:MAG: sterol desaturase family protein [Pseudomonadota bacterium]
MSDTNDKARGKSRFAGQWHYRPDVPIAVSPFFRWPFDFRQAWRWVVQRWFALTENTIIVALAYISWRYFQPPLEQMASLELWWVAHLFARNFVLLLIVAGGLHLYFHRFRKQGERLKYDPRPLKGGRTFTFNSQVADNMFWSLGSGVCFWTAYEVGLFWAMANGYIPSLPLWGDSVWGFVWFVALFFLTPVWISFHFYWIHRALHWPPLYRLAHALHHRNVNVGPWSGFSMHPVEHLLFLSSVLIHAIVPAHPLHILFHMQHQALTAATSHTGFESLLVKDKSQLALGTFHHQMHHRYFECNYGNLEVPWDKWFGSFHDGTEESHAAFLERRKAYMARQVQK